MPTQEYSPEVVDSFDVRDEALIARLLAGDESALELLYDRYSPLVYGLSRRVTNNEQIACEITQEVFVHVWQHPDRIDLQRGSLQGYFGVLTHRRAVDAVRSSERRSKRERSAQQQVPVENAGSDHDVVHTLTSAWQSKRLLEILAGLPTELRRAIELAYYEGLTYKQVAQRLAIPEGTAKSRMRAALARLRELIENDDRAAWTTS